MLIPAIILTQAQQSATPQHVQGAARVLERIRAVAGDKRLNLESLDAKNEMLSYARASGRMSPSQAAAQWLKLLADIHATWTKPAVAARPKSGDVVAVLPPPAAWPLIAATVAPVPAAKRTERDLMLKLLFDELNGNRAAERADMDALIAKLPVDQSNSLAWEAGRLNVSLAARLDDKSWLVDAAVKNCEITGSLQLWIGNRAADFVTIVGKERARPILKKLLLSNSGQVNSMNSFGDEPTTVLLVELAVESLAELKSAPWGLAARIPGARLYPILAKRWPRPPGEVDGANSDHGRSMAKLIYAISLELDGKHEVAQAQTDDWDWRIQDQSDIYFVDQALDRPEYKRAFFTLEASLAGVHPEKVSWGLLGPIAKEIGRTADFMALAQSMPPNRILDEKIRKVVTDAQIDGLLEVDKVEEAVKLLQGQVSKQANSRDFSNDRYDASLRLAVVGTLTEHPEWVREGLDAAEGIESRYAGGSGPFFMGRYQNLPKLLISLGRNDEAERYLAKQLIAPAGEGYGGGSPRQYLGELVRLYYHANRPADVLALFEKAPGWGGSDLSDVYFDGFSSSFRSEAPLGFYAAWALAKTGRKDEALRVLEPCLFFARTLDAGYALLLDLEGADAISILDKLFVRDRFEARPLIWKAEALRRAGRLPEAETVARSAISLDPSDGGSPAGDRLRAYAVLADIRAAQGASDEATQLRNAVQAIRMSEHADDLIQAGLIERGAKEYQAALAKFDDAYCIQSRLAIQLAAEGRNEEAAEHFRRAYELMPSSFGRVESHCLGCEGAFRSEAAQHIAIDVLSGIAKKTPNNARVHYLLGYVYEAQNHRAEAIAEFKRAVELDPEYLNAWSHLGGLAVGVDGTTAARAGVAMAKLDPSGFHAEARVDSVEPKALWKAVEAAKVSVYLMSRNLMPIHPGAQPDYRPGDQYPREVDWPQVGRNGYQDGGNAPWRIPTTPSLRVSQLEIVSSIANLLSADEQDRNGMMGSG